MDACRSTPIDTENELRKLTIGRKNWLFFGREAGGEVAAHMYSVITRATCHQLDLWAYLDDVPRSLSSADVDLERLLPDRCAADRPESIRTYRQQESQARAATTNARRARRPRLQRPLEYRTLTPRQRYRVPDDSVMAETAMGHVVTSATRESFPPPFTLVGLSSDNPSRRHRNLHECRRTGKGTSPPRKKEKLMAGTLSTQRRGSLTPGMCASGGEARMMSLATSQSAGYRLRRSAKAHGDNFGVPLKTKGEIEAAICEFISHFEQDYMGRGPKSIRAHLIGELLVVRLQGVLTAAEQQLCKAHPAEKGRNLLKQVRIHLIESARPIIESMVHLVTGARMLSLHHDISTVTGEEVMLFTLAEAPDCRQPKKRLSQESDWDS